jgi:four helix bundle protein
MAGGNVTYDLEERLIAFAVSSIRTAGKLPPSVAGKHLASQLIRSGSSPALHYGEAQASERRADFIHKMKMALKELRETFVNLQVIRNLKWMPDERMEQILGENNQLISIFVKSIATAIKNKQNVKPDQGD